MLDDANRNDELQQINLDVFNANETMDNTKALNLQAIEEVASTREI